MASNTDNPLHRSRGTGSRSTPATAVSSILNTVIAAKDRPPVVTSLSVLGKRSRADDDEDEHESDTELGAIPRNDTSSREASTTPSPSDNSVTADSSSTASANRNLRSYAQAHMSQYKLTTAQVKAIEDFATDSSKAQAIKLYTALFVLQNQLEKWETSKPAFVASVTLKVNIRNTVFKLLLSSDLSQYKGEDVKKEVQNIIKARNWVPKNMEDESPAEWQEIRGLVTRNFTDLRSDIKKKLQESVAGNNPSEMWRISKLAYKLGQNKGVKLCAPLCGRLALLRAVFREQPGDSFWNAVDATIAKVRAEANYDATQIRNAFAAVLDHDRELYGKPGDDEREILDPQDLNKA